MRPFAVSVASGYPACMERKPRIGVTLWSDIPPEAEARYLDRIREAGGEIVRLEPENAADAAEIAAGLDGLVLTGGIDVEPDVYGAERHAKVKETDRARDEMEIAALHGAIGADIPVLAICRGHQVLNVGFGGALLQHIDSGEHRADFRTPGYPSRWHDVRIAEGNRLSEALGGTRFEVNSRHHQAVTEETLAPGLRPIAWSDDHGRDLIEGVESERHTWVVGVQWHPERLEEHKEHYAPLMRRLFDAFIAQTRRVRA